MIGANASVVGKINIGSNARIGAGCAVACDIPENATVVSQAPRIILRESSETNVFHSITEK